MATSDDAYDLEFRSPGDDAWYSIRVVLHGEMLTVKYQNFSEMFDERYNACDFVNLEAVEEFFQRFRPMSEQLQDRQCNRVIEGMTVCASYSSKDNDLRFFDAVVDTVDRKDHSFEKKEEECLCTFLLFWQHGPNEGYLSLANIADICLVRYSAYPDSTLASFSNLVKDRIKMAFLRSSSVSEVRLSGPTLSKGKPKLILPQDGLQETECAGQFFGAVRTKEGRAGKCCQQSDHDRDIGGVSPNMNSIGETGSHHYIVIDNLEKDLSPTLIMEFIHKQTSISPQAYVFPSLSTESYTRGAIVLDSKAKLKNIYDFLCNPNHIIISLTGRPWVITEKILRCGTFRITLGSLMPKSQSENIENQLKVVRLGTEEYNRANRLRGLFMDFLDHQRRLHERLASEEKKTLLPSHAI